MSIYRFVGQQRPLRHAAATFAASALLLGSWTSKLEAQGTPPPPPSQAVTPALTPTPQAPTAVAPPPAPVVPAPAPVAAPPPVAPAAVPVLVAPPPAGAPPPVYGTSVQPAPLPPEEQPELGIPPSVRERMNMTLSYSMGFAMGDLKDFVGEPSYRGFDFAMVWPIFRSFYVGFDLGYQLFYDEKDRETYEFGTSAVTAKLYRDANFWSGALSTRYLFLEPMSIVRPYLGLKLGMTAVSTSTLVADFSYYDNPLGFLLTPEGGILVRFSDFISGVVSYQYNFTTASTDRFDNLSFGTLQLGIAMRF